MLKIYEEPKASKDEVYLKLVEEGGKIFLKAVDKYGRLMPAGNILSISSDGIKRCLSLGDLGFDKDEDEKIQIR